MAVAISLDAATRPRDYIKAHGGAKVSIIIVADELRTISASKPWQRDLDLPTASKPWQRDLDLPSASKPWQLAA